MSQTPQRPKDSTQVPEGPSVKTHDPDEGQALPPQKSGPIALPVVILGLLVLAGLAIFVVVKVVSGVRTIAPAVKEGWQEISEIRAADARTVESQLEAGAAYADKLTLAFSAEVAGATDSGLKVRLLGKISNNGDKDVLAASALLEFPYKDAAKPLYTRTLVLFDASPNSVRPNDRRLGGGEVRDLDLNLEDVPPDCDAAKVAWRLSSVRVDVDGPPRAQGAQ